MIEKLTMILNKGVDLYCRIILKSDSRLPKKKNVLFASLEAL